jgi:hypothetical protein
MRGLWKLKVGIILLTLTSCSASYHLKRAIAKDPTIVKSQPVIIDTTVITEIRVSKGSFVIDRDTSLLFEQKGVRTQIKVVSDTFWVETICPPDTIRIQKEILVPKLVYQEKLSNFDLVKLILVIIIILSLIAFFRKLIKT